MRHAPREERLSDRIAALAPVMRRYALKLTRDGEAAGDLVQDTLARGIAKRHLFRDGTDLRAWLFTIMHNQHLNVIRDSYRRGRDRDVDLDALANSNFEPRYGPTQDLGMQVREMVRALEMLPKEYRDVILAVGYSGLKYEVAAELLGIPDGTVRSRLHRGRVLLREMTER